MSATATLSVELRDLALTVAREAAALVRERRESPVEVADTKSSSVDIVTEADRASEALLRSLLLAARPDDAFLGEEGGSGEGTTGVRWVVDPIDGTVNFLYGLPQYAVSVAAELDGEVVAGAVINAATGVEYAATRGGGATRDGVPIRVRPVAPLSERLVITGFNYDAGIRTLQAAAAARLLPHVRDIRRLGSAALDLAWTAAGRYDAYFERGTKAWDVAAGRLVCARAGLEVRELAPDPPADAGILVAPAALLAPLQRYLG